MFCTRCGAETSEESQFCAKCGQALDVAATTGARATAPPGETTFYADGAGVRVTNSRLIIDDITFAMRNITSVKMVVKPPDRIGPVLLMILSVAVTIGGIALSFPLGTIVGMVGVGAMIAVLATLKPTYHLSITSASGEVEPRKSQNEAEIKKLVQAINEAIIHRG